MDEYAVCGSCVWNDLPVQTKGVQECWKTFHTKQNEDSKDKPHGKTNKDANHGNGTSKAEPNLECHVPQDAW